MSNIKTIKEQFRPLLPVGFVRIIQQKLNEKGIYRSKSFISEACNPEKSKYDNDVASIALDLAAEEKQKEIQILSKAETLA